MNKDEISRIREDLLASHPDLPEDRLSDNVIEAAAKRVSQKTSQEPTEHGEPGLVKPVEKIVAPISGTVAKTSNLESGSGRPDEKDIMNAVLADLQGDGQKFTIDNPDLANAVDQVLKMPRNE